MWSTLGAKRCPLSGLGDRTPYAPRRRGGPTSGGVPFRVIKKAFLCGVLWHTLLNRCRPDLGALKTMWHRLRKRWDENTLLNKRPHRPYLRLLRFAPTTHEGSRVPRPASIDKTDRPCFVSQRLTATSEATARCAERQRAARAGARSEPSSARRVALIH